MQRVTSVCFGYRLVKSGALVATRASEGEAAILTSTSLTGFWVQAWVT